MRRSTVPSTGAHTYNTMTMGVRIQEYRVLLRPVNFGWVSSPGIHRQGGIADPTSVPGVNRVRTADPSPPLISVPRRSAYRPPSTRRDRGTWSQSGTIRRAPGEPTRSGAAEVGRSFGVVVTHSGSPASQLPSPTPTALRRPRHGLLAIQAVEEPFTGKVH